MRITFRNVTPSWGPDMYEIRADGKEVGFVQSHSEVRGKWFWYALGMNTCHTPADDLETAKRQATGHVKRSLSRPAPPRRLG